MSTPAPAPATDDLDLTGDGPDDIDRLLRWCWHPVALAEEIVGEPVTVELLGERIVVVRLDGAVRALAERCPHRGASLGLGWVHEDCVVCPYHGWHYAGDGQVAFVPSLGLEGRVPARTAVASYRCAEHLGLIWVALDDPVVDLPRFDEMGAGEMKVVACPPYEWNAHAVRRVENFLDFAHFPWIHPGILGDRARPQVPPFIVERDGTTLVVDQHRVEPTLDDVKTMGLGLDGVVESDMDYVVQLPLTARLHQRLPGGRRYLVWLTASPVAKDRVRTFWFVARNYEVDDDDEKYVRFQEDVVAQDQPVIESQRPRRPPLDHRAEVAVKDDRLLVEYRRALIELAQTAGVIPR